MGREEKESIIDETGMKFSLILGVVLLLTVAHIVQTRKVECTSCGGSLGSGTNPCKCSDVVVKAAKVEKPLYHATPQTINEAATAREVAQLISTRTFPGNVASFSAHSQPSRLYGISNGISHSSSSSSSISSASSSSSVGLFGQSIGGGFYPSSRKPTYDFGCGCGSKAKMSLELNDLLSSNTQGKVVPRFPPIGDLCTPNKHSSYEVSTKVTPAYPKLNFQTVEPLCVNVVNGQIDRADLGKLASVTSYSGIGGLLDGSIGRPIGRYVSDGVGNLDRYTSNAASNTLGYDSFGSSSAKLSHDGWTNSNEHRSNIFGYGNRQDTLDSWYKPDWYAGSSGMKLDSRTNSFDEYGASHGNVIASNKCTDFGEDLELPEDYSYPRQPADAVSLTLAYKNLFPHTAIRNKKWFVPEDKLAFGHRTVPVESTPGKRPSDIPEEKLQVLDKPIVELKPMHPIPISLGVYDQQEEAKLAELEAIERERINQEENANQPQGNFITYGDLGYAPVDGLIVPGKLTRPGASQINSGISLTDAEDIVGGGCGPVGPPVPGYVPGSIVVNREVIETEEENENDTRRNGAFYVRHHLDDVSDEEEDSDDTTTGIFARLRSTAQKYGPVTCPR